MNNSDRACLEKLRLICVGVANFCKDTIPDKSPLESLPLYQAAYNKGCLYITKTILELINEQLNTTTAPPPTDIRER